MHSRWYIFRIYVLYAFSSYNYFVVRIETLQLGEGLVQEGINGTARGDHGKHHSESGSFGIIILRYM